MLMQARSHQHVTHLASLPPLSAAPESSQGFPQDQDLPYGARLITALEGLNASLDQLRWPARQSIRQSDRMELLTLFKLRHGVMPTDLETAIRTQEPEALAFRLAGDPRLLRAVELLAMR
ncbi:MAG: hypothetical protein ACI8QS_001720 [Planctomycetota bacterium]|jgi:hypothetical protein